MNVMYEKVKKSINESQSNMNKIGDKILKGSQIKFTIRCIDYRTFPKICMWLCIRSEENNKLIIMITHK